MAGTAGALPLPSDPTAVASSRPPAGLVPSSMLTTGLLLLTVAAAPIKVATMRLNLLDSSESWADFYTGYFADRLIDQGLEVTSPRELTALLGLERQRQLLGCEDDSSCLIEIAGAIGVDG